LEGISTGMGESRFSRHRRNDTGDGRQEGEGPSLQALESDVEWQLLPPARTEGRKGEGDGEGEERRTHQRNH